MNSEDIEIEAAPVNPNRVGEKGELVAVVFSMARVRRDLPFLREGADVPSGSDENARATR